MPNVLDTSDTPRYLSNMKPLRPFAGSLLGRPAFPKPIYPSILFPTEASCTTVHLTPIAPLPENPLLLCIEESEAFKCLRNVYPRFTQEDYQWWRYYHGFEMVSRHAPNSTSVVSYLGFTQEEWAEYDEKLKAQPGHSMVPTTVLQRRPVGRPPKGSGFFPMAMPRRVGQYVRSIYEAPPLLFKLVDTPSDLHEPESACIWSGTGRRLTTVDAVHSLLSSAIRQERLRTTGAELSIAEPVTHADALMWLYVNGFSKHIMVAEVATGAKRTVFSAPAELFLRMEMEYKSKALVSTPTFDSSTCSSLGHPAPRFLDPDGILMECD